MDYTNEDVWLNGVLEAFEKASRDAARPLVRDAAVMALGGKPSNPGLASLPGILRLTRRDTGESQNSVRVVEGEANSFPYNKGGPFAELEDAVAQRVAEAKAIDSDTITIGTSLERYKFEERYGAPFTTTAAQVAAGLKSAKGNKS
jgi:hypothetical protein